MSAALVPADPFQMLDTSEAGPELGRLHDLVVSTTGRVRLVGADGEVSVLISQVELDSLERALAVLSSTDGVRELCDAVAHVAHEVASG